MTVEITYLQSKLQQIIQNGGNLEQVEVTVALQDLPAGSFHNVQRFLKQLPNGQYIVTGYLIPHADYFNIVPTQIVTAKPHELIRVFHDDMRRFRPNGLPVKARRYTQPNQPSTQFEDAIIQPL